KTLRSLCQRPGSSITFEHFVPWTWSCYSVKLVSMATVTTNVGLPLVERESRPKKARYTGEVVYMYAYDVAYEMTREPVEYLLGQRTEPFSFGATKRNPRHLFF